MNDSTTSKDAVVIERTFDASIDLVWQMWTDSEHFKRWYGPTGFTVPVADMDLRVGGRRLICMASPDGSMNMWTTGEYTEIVRYINSALFEELKTTVCNHTVALHLSKAQTTIARSTLCWLTSK